MLLATIRPCSRPRVASRSGHYHLVGTGPRWQCKGYHDGDEFHWCSASTTMPARGPFKVPEELKTKFGIPTGPSEASTSTSAGPSTVD